MPFYLTRPFSRIAYFGATRIKFVLNFEMASICGKDWYFDATANASIFICNPIIRHGTSVGKKPSLANFEPIFI